MTALFFLVGKFRPRGLMKLRGGAVKKAGKSRSHRLHGLVEKNHGYKIKTKCGIIYQENEYLKVNFFETKVNFKKVKNAPTYNRREMLSSI